MTQETNIADETFARSERFHRPEVCEGYIERGQLAQRLQQYQRPLMLVVAPPGYGKTTVASRLATTTNDDVAWITLSETVDDLRRFLYILAHAWQSIYPRASEKLRHFADSEVVPGPELIASAIRVEFDDESPSSILVLDDYYTIRETSVHDLVDSLLAHLLNYLKVFILSRSSPPLRLGRLRSQGKVIDVRQRDLRFTLDETHDFIRHRLSAYPDYDTLKRLQSLTEGWPAGLQLILLAAEGRNGVEDFVKTINGSIWQIEDYLLEELLDSLDDVTQNILNRLGLLEQFCEESINACISIAGFENANPGAFVMETIRSRGMFLIPLDTNQKCFRFHHLFHDMLHRRALRTLSAEEIRSIKKRAAAWMRQIGEIERAIAYYVEAGETDLAADIVNTEGIKALNSRSAFSAERLMEILPNEAFEDNPDLLILRALTCMLGSRYSGMFDCLNALQRLADTNGGLSKVNNSRLQVLESSRAFLAAQFGNIQDRAGEIPKRFSFERASAIMLYGTVKLLAGSKTDAQRYLYAALEAAENDVPRSRARILTGICFHHWYLGELKQLKKFANQLLIDGKERQDDFTVIYALWFKVAAEYFLNDLEGAVETLQLVEKRSSWPHQHSYVNCMRIAVAVHLAVGDIDKAEDIVSALISHQIGHNTTTWLPELLATQADVALLAGHEFEAYQWALDYELHSITVPHGFGTASMTAARLLLRQGSREALEKADDIIMANEAFFANVHASRFELEVMILRALHLSKTGDMDTAVAKMTDAVLLAKPNGNIRIFADFGPEIAPLLSRVQLNNAHLRFIGEILRATGANKNGADSEQSSYSRNGDHSVSLTVETISKRERDVLQLVAKNLTYKEIAQELFIAPATVKRHTHNIYGKLNVKDRRAAVAKASGLGLV